MPRGAPTYLTIGADGSIGADFTGHISAQGVDLTASNTASIPNDNKITWRRSSNGAYVASIAASRDVDGSGLLSGLLLNAQSESFPNNHASLILAGINGGAGPGQVRVDAQNNAGPVSQRTVIDGDGKSNFLQVGGAPGLSGVGIGTLTWTAAGVFGDFLAVGPGGAVTGIVATADATTTGQPVTVRSLPAFGAIEGATPVAVPAGTTAAVCFIWWK